MMVRFAALKFNVAVMSILSTTGVANAQLTINGQSVQGTSNPSPLPHRIRATTNPKIIFKAVLPICVHVQLQRVCQVQLMIVTPNRLHLTIQ